MASKPSDSTRASRHEDGAVICVGLGEASVGRLRAELRSLDVEAYEQTHEQALESAGTRSGAVVYLIEWTDQGAESLLAYCQRLRMEGSPAGVAVVVVANSEPVLGLYDALGSSVDDVLLRPFGADLRSRLRVWLRSAARPTSLSARAALHRALRSGEDGEVVIESDAGPAGIHVQRGHLVWAHLLYEPASLEEVLGESVRGVDAETLAAVREECRTSRKHFVEVLVAWRLLEEPIAREAVRRFVGERVARILALPRSSALFIPRARRRTEKIRFKASELEELRSDEHALHDFPAEATHAVLEEEGFSALVETALTLSGAESAVVVDKATGSVLAESGRPFDRTALAVHLNGVTILQGSNAEALYATPNACVVVRTIPWSMHRALVVSVSLSDGTIGMARASVLNLLDSHSSRSSVEDAGKDFATTRSG